jgi:fused signal recognition particle receptor
MIGGLFGRLREGLSKTREALVGKVEALFQSHPQIDEEFLESLEEILLAGDFGMPVTQELVAALRRRAKTERQLDVPRLRAILAEEVGARLQAGNPWTLPAAQPCVIMLVGVNGVGKTTTIGKLAGQFIAAGRRVVIGAGDTFRAAATEQLQIWGERAGAEVVRGAAGTDPGAVAFDAARAALARNAEVLLLDTAGRLHTKANLMEELKKVRRVLAREIPGAPHETWLVLDATTGQNALSQARLFREAVDISGIVLTKLDGTAKGGIVVAIGAELGLTVHYVGVGEGIDDLRPFDAAEFVAALFQND